jgi:hypothetical protein
MTRDLAAAIQWVRDHPTRKGIGKWRLGYGYSWSQLCVALVFDALGATHSYGNANLARVASNLVPGSSTDLTPPAGSFAWFDYGKYGHVAFSDGRRLYMASRFTNNIGTALGTLTAEQYAHDAHARYLGYSWDFGGQRFAGVTTSSLGTTHLLTPPATKEEDTIMRFKTKNLYITDLFTSVEAITQAEAEALNDGSGGVHFEPVSSDNAKLIIAGVKRRRLAALAEQAAAIGQVVTPAVIAAVSKQFDDLTAHEQGFTAADVATAVADDIAARLKS